MLNSALIMAGANIKKTEEDVTEDGILTALEISKLNIGAKLVVLSACETALGEQRNEEGVFGLQRAFKLAGAEFLMMTLWKIPDKQTFEMMQIFYSTLAKEVSIEESFRIAQNEMKKKYSPFYWAGFILVN
jgi:CHAT domain-containing protein